ncbi:MOSC domain-containing protein [uncultured Nocardioides sp.]|uniref:MOSC domain-containing protein n=1 Tax=uncultured Nocardioides sp. TaxID=198441 RepID=UPI0025E2817C|nr:MOSC N-terminal beta barrel domain-containing protein [uncultured Nocardioides sp.]
MSLTLTGLNLHPVKSTAVRPVTTAQVVPAGLVDDRTWIVVDGDDVMVTARGSRELFTLVADTPATDPDLTRALRLTAPGMPELLLDQPTGPPAPVRLFSQDLLGVPVGPVADEWLRTALGRPGLRLLWCDDPTRRGLDPAHTRPGDHTAYADGYPVTLASETSLRQLNDWIVEGALERGEEVPDPLPMARFRPSLVIDGAEPFAEDHWSWVQVGEVRLRMALPTGRCVVSTIDVDSLATGKEPIRTLARHRRSASGTLFAVNLVPEGGGTLRVGDPVSVG